MKLRYTKPALRDLAVIYEVRAEKSIQTAQRIEDYLSKSIESLAQRPRQGIPTMVARVRRLPVKRYRYTVFYRFLEVERLVEVLRVVPSSRVRDLNKVPND